MLLFQVKLGVSNPILRPHALEYRVVLVWLMSKSGVAGGIIRLRGTQYIFSASAARLAGSAVMQFASIAFC